MTKSSWRTYLIAFLITSSIFALAFGLSNTLNKQRVEEIRQIQNEISIDILSTETQFSLLENLSCGDIGTSFLSQELSSIGARLEFMEKERSSDDPEFVGLKKYYSLLLIKDYLLAERVRERCGAESISILYFYSNEGDCKECGRQGAVLTRLQELYPDVRVYPFDYNIDTPAIDALVSVHDIKPQFPALKFKGETYYGLHTIEDLERMLPELIELKEVREAEQAARENATSTEE